VGLSAAEGNVQVQQVGGTRAEDPRPPGSFPEKWAGTPQRSQREAAIFTAGSRLASSSAKLEVQGVMDPYCSAAAEGPRLRVPCPQPAQDRQQREGALI